MLPVRRRPNMGRPGNRRLDNAGQKIDFGFRLVIGATTVTPEAKMATPARAVLTGV
jgi:hypothetical protein